MIDTDAVKAKEFQSLQKNFVMDGVEAAYRAGYHYMIIATADFDRGYYQAWECSVEETSQDKALGSKFLKLPARAAAMSLHGTVKNVLVFKTRAMAMDMYKDPVAGPYLNQAAGIIHLIDHPFSVSGGESYRGRGIAG